MPKLTPEEWVDKMITNAGNSVESVVKGVERMKETPGAAAVRKKDAYRKGVARALEDGSFDAGHLSYNITDFKERAIPKIRERYASGMVASRPKALASVQQLHTHMQNLQREVQSLPDDTDQQREARMLANLRGMKKFKLSRPRR